MLSPLLATCTRVCELTSDVDSSNHESVRRRNMFTIVKQTFYNVKLILYFINSCLLWINVGLYL